MKKYLWIIVVVAIMALLAGAAAALFITGAVRFSWLPMNSFAAWSRKPILTNFPAGFTCGNNPAVRNFNGGMGMMRRNSANGCSGVYTDRISLDEALQKAETYTASAGDNFAVAEIMEFSRNFYVVVIEKDGGRAAFELLVDPFSGNVFPEYGPNMMWNVKYGHMGNGSSPENSLSLEEARRKAQEALDRQIAGAEIEGDGFSFYGYYTFDYAVEGQIAGMLSVNGFTGQVWLHTWHGEFISEKELLE